MGALIESYSEENRVIDASLTVVYFCRLIHGMWIGTSVVTSSAQQTYSEMHEYHRVAKKSYKYVGMTKEAADSCVSGMKSIYTRTVKCQKWNPTAGNFGDWEDLSASGTEMSAEITSRNVAGEMWEVTINVNEDSVYMAKTNDIKSYDTIFASEKERQYDGESEG